MERIEEAMDFVNNQLSVDDSSMLVGRASAPADANHVTLASQDQSTACSSVSSATNNAPDPNLDRLANQNEVKIPSELIVHCVATLLMIQVISCIYAIVFCLRSHLSKQFRFTIINPLVSNQKVEYAATFFCLVVFLYSNRPAVSLINHFIKTFPSLYLLFLNA